MPVCSRTAGCELRESEYIEGQFPSGQRIVVATQGPGTIRLEFYLDETRYKGEITEVKFSEPGCGVEYEYVTDRPAIDLLTGGPEFRELVDAGGDLDAYLTQDHTGAAEFARARGPFLLY